MKLFISLLLLSFSINSIAQNNYNPKDFSRKPLWINMMQDTNANYFIAQIAYDSFWKDREKPLNEEGSIGEQGAQNLKSTGNIFQRIHAQRELKRKKEMHDAYFLECKRFEHWLFINKPYVQEDGSILSAQEQSKIYQQQIKNSQEK